MPTHLAVLTGDIVGSSALPAPDLERVMEAVRAASADIAAWCGGPPQFARFRGDGWQMVLERPELALRGALFVRAALRAEGRRLETRISIGIGPGEIAPGGGPATGQGEVFRLSGRGLDAMVRPARLAIAWSAPPPDAAKTRAITALCDELARRWTPAQARVLRHTLPPGMTRQAEIAARLGVTQQMVAKHLKAAGEWALLQGLAAFEAEG